MKMTEEEKHIHDGHRKRLQELAFRAGFENLTSVQAVELFLTYIFPRNDVNPLAHRLLDQYETFTNIIEADWRDLKKIKGLNDRSAQKIVMFRDMFFRYSMERMGRKCKVENVSELIDIIEDNLRFRTTEHMVLISLSPADIITHKKIVTVNETIKVSIPTMEIANFLSFSKPASFVVGHCHPFGRAVPSQSDVKACEIIEQLCKTCGIKFVDSFILGDDGVFSQVQNTYMRKYVDTEQLQSTIHDLIAQNKQ